MDNTKQWYIVYTKTGSEQKVCEALRRKKIESFYPVNKLVKNSSGRERITFKPLLERYVFVLLGEEELQVMKHISGIVNYVFWLSEPVIVQQEDIYLLRRFLKMYDDIRLEKIKVNLSQPANMLGITTENGEELIQFSFPALGFNMIAQENNTKVKIITVPGYPSKTNSTNNKYAEAR